MLGFLLNLQPLKRKFVRCSAHVTIGLLQKYIARKLKLEAANQVNIAKVHYGMFAR